MGSVGLDGEDEYQPSTSNSKKYKLPRTLLEGCGAVDHASVPRKLRSAIKKRGRESVTPPLPISKKQYNVSNGVERLRKDGAKKSKMNMKQVHITKDEEEVAETLYALAGMFSDAERDNKPELHDEPPEIKSSAIPEAGSYSSAVADTGNQMLQEESQRISSKVTLQDASHSPDVMDSQVAKFQSSGDAEQPQLPFNMQPATASTSGVPSDLSLDRRPMVSTLDMNPTFERAIAPEQAAASQNGKHYYPTDDENNAALRSETQGSGIRIPAWFENTNHASQPCATENGITAERHTQAAVGSKRTWKRCSAHVCISRLIKVLQVSETKEGLLEKPTRLTTCDGAELRPPASIHNQMTGMNSGVSFNGATCSTAEKDSAEIQNDILLHKSPLQNQPPASETSSAKQGYNFLSLGTRVGGLDASDCMNRAGHGHEAPKQFHASYMQPQNHSPMLFSLSQNGYSSPTFHGHNSALAAQQVQLPQYLSSTVNSNFAGRTGQQLESQQHKWATQYNTGRVSSPHLPDWKNGGRDSSSMLNYAHALFPHLHAALGSKYQQLSPQQQQQLMAINSSSLPISSVKRQHNLHIPLGFERNGTAIYPENIPQLQLPCNQNL
ncbi:hypothetical protein Salat_1237700 [Sesamum alatum]|uniref:Uncharacterized protein n=1 Tax=Sesamum alatum TaxID=300844 RepID=A0AAE1YGW8_9LAMI|nr:hypothetical protein Salat_1237700 [Sesamum alatum]